MVESLLSTADVGVRSTINASMFTDATSIRPDTSSSSLKVARTRPATTTAPQMASERRTTTTTTVPRTEGASARRTTTSTIPPAVRAARRSTGTLATHPTPQRSGERAPGGRRNNLSSSLQLAGGSSGVSHTPLSLLSPATHRVAAAKVVELRQSRADRNWTSPRRQRAGARPGAAG